MSKSDSVVLSVILSLSKDLLFCSHKEEILPPYSRLNDRQMRL